MAARQPFCLCPKALSLARSSAAASPQPNPWPRPGRQTSPCDVDIKCDETSFSRSLRLRARAGRSAKSETRNKLKNDKDSNDLSKFKNETENLLNKISRNCTLVVQRGSAKGISPAWAGISRASQRETCFEVKTKHNHLSSAFSAALCASSDQRERA